MTYASVRAALRGAPRGSAVREKSRLLRYSASPVGALAALPERRAAGSTLDRLAPTRVALGRVVGFIPVGLAVRFVARFRGPCFVVIATAPACIVSGPCPAANEGTWCRAGSGRR